MLDERTRGAATWTAGMFTAAVAVLWLLAGLYGLSEAADIVEFDGRCTRGRPAWAAAQAVLVAVGLLCWAVAGVVRRRRLWWLGGWAYFAGWVVTVLLLAPDAPAVQCPLGD